MAEIIIKDKLAQEEWEKKIQKLCSNPYELSVAKNWIKVNREVIKSGRMPITILLENDKPFPIFEGDNLESVSKRYIDLYPEEAAGLKVQCQEDKKENETGMSDEKTLRKVCSIPVLIYKTMDILEKGYWGKENYSNYRRFAALFPVYFTKGGIGK